MHPIAALVELKWCKIVLKGICQEWECNGILTYSQSSSMSTGSCSMSSLQFARRRRRGSSLIQGWISLTYSGKNYLFSIHNYICMAVTYSLWKSYVRRNRDILPEQCDKWCFTRHHREDRSETRLFFYLLFLQSACRISIIVNTQAKKKKKTREASYVKCKQLNLALTKLLYLCVNLHVYVHILPGQPAI